MKVIPIWLSTECVVEKLRTYLKAKYGYSLVELEPDPTRNKSARTKTIRFKVPEKNDFLIAIHSFLPDNACHRDRLRRYYNIFKLDEKEIDDIDSDCSFQKVSFEN